MLRFRVPVCLVVICTALTPTAAVADGPRVRLVKDIYPGDQPGFYGASVVMNGVMYFVGFDPTYGRELWRTDGTTPGTVMVKDINPGPQESSLSSPIVHGNWIIFFAFTSTAGWQCGGATARRLARSW